MFRNVLNLIKPFPFSLPLENCIEKSIVPSLTIYIYIFKIPDCSYNFIFLKHKRGRERKSSLNSLPSLGIKFCIFFVVVVLHILIIFEILDSRNFKNFRYSRGIAIPNLLDFKIVFKYPNVFN